MDNQKIDLNINIDKIKDHKEYLDIWRKMGKIQIKMVEKNEVCKHELGDTYIYENPYTKPQNVCSALLHVLDLYTWRTALGFPSWNVEDRKVFKIHCPDPKGTVWEMSKID